MRMSRRRWAVLATTLVALNLFFWLASPGLAVRNALRTSILNQLFGPRMVKAEVIVLGSDGTPQDYRIDRGVVVSVTASALTIDEADGSTQTIPVGPTTRVTGMPGRFAIMRLPRGARVLVLHLANDPASTIQVESRGP
jgi:hypothetical protein